MEKLNFHADYYRAGAELPKKDRLELWEALLAYAFEGVEPQLKGATKAVFIALRARVDASIQGVANAKARKAPTGTPSKAPSEGYPEAPCEGPAENPGRGEARPLGTVQEYKSTRVQEGCRGLGGGNTPRAAYDPQVNPPTVEEVRDYFGCSCLRGDPEAFFAQYAATAWLDGKGQEIRDWHAQAMKWHKMQVSRDAEASARGQPTPSEAVWKPARTAEEELAEVEADLRRKGMGDLLDGGGAS